MPTSEEILQGLADISNNFTWIAVVWHVLFYFLIAALILKWKPSNRLLSFLLGFPLVSVSLLGWISGNPFNGFIFAICGVLLVVYGMKNQDSPISTGHSWSTVLGTVVILFGLIYPHFLETDNYFDYLYKAPVGLIPCPTLSAVIGFSILYQGFQSRVWPWFLIIPGLIYAVIGVFRLAVYLDMVLLVATVSLIIVTFQVPKVQSSIKKERMANGPA
ncbi:MAG: hypothetical protein KFF73_01925 [Cyclobacteriaceae bacterium]|nr:hypothetical protein [Cyclobacteriaceae bacterium]